MKDPEIWREFFSVWLPICGVVSEYPLTSSCPRSVCDGYSAGGQFDLDFQSRLDALLPKCRTQVWGMIHQRSLRGSSPVRQQSQ